LILISDNSGFLQRRQVKFYFDSAGVLARMLAGMAMLAGQTRQQQSASRDKPWAQDAGWRMSLAVAKWYMSPKFRCSSNGSGVISISKASQTRVIVKQR
jgi:hypothetical protein